MVTQGAPLSRDPGLWNATPLALKTFHTDATVGRCHSIPCDGAFDVHGDAVGNGRISCGHGTYANGVRFQSPGLRQRRVPGSRETIQRGYPNGVAQSPDVHGRAALVLNEGLVRGQGGFVKPRWGWDCVRCGNPGRAAIARPWALECNAVGVKTFSYGREVGRCHSIPCDGAFDVHGATRLAMDEYLAAHGTYANGVRFQSPGFAATRVPWVSRETIQRDYPNGVAQSPDVHGGPRIGVGRADSNLRADLARIDARTNGLFKSWGERLRGTMQRRKRSAERSTFTSAFGVRIGRPATYLWAGVPIRSGGRFPTRLSSRQTYIYNVDGIKQLNARAGASLDEDGLTRAEASSIASSDASLCHANQTMTYGPTMIVTRKPLTNV